MNYRNYWLYYIQRGERVFVESYSDLDSARAAAKELQHEEDTDPNWGHVSYVRDGMRVEIVGHYPQSKYYVVYCEDSGTDVFDASKRV